MKFKKRINGSWTDIPYYINNTVTDIITTLPTVLYPTGITVTVGLKGQVVQSSTPSPTSPVMPQGCGDLETSGEKAGQYKISISSANTTTPVYLGEVETTRKIRKLVLTGTSLDGNTNITAQGIIYITPSPTLQSVREAYCTHFKYVNQGQGSDMPSNSFTTSGGAGTSLWFKTDYTSVADFKAWLAAQYAAGTPVTVWYVLATEKTAVVNEPLMKIGDYADEITNISVPTIVGTNTFDVDTTVQPSEVTLYYHGWHPITNVHEHNNGAWN